MSAVLALTACGSGGNPATTSTAAAENPFAGTAAGTLRTSGFNPSDEVGQSRADYAAGSCRV